MTSVDEIGPWSRKKLELLGKYLVTYTSIMNTPKVRSWCTGCHYIDAFAGSVTPFDKDAQQYIDGSPRVALKTAPCFDSYSFIDIEEGRVNDNLQPLIEEFPSRDIALFNGDCNEVFVESILPQYLSSRGKSRKRGFVFLDPYGLELDWNTVKAVGEAGVFDTFINFSVMGVTRQCSTIPPGGEEKLKIDRLMGAEDWIDEVYKDTSQGILPGIEDTKLVKKRQKGVTDNLIEYYRRRLRTCFAHVSKAVIMRNSMNGPLYALILASQQKLAVTKMHEIFDRDSRNSGA